MIIDRRSFLKYGALGASTYFLPQFSWAQSSESAHQVLHIHFSGAMDFTYGFDARRLSMTKANLLQNYLNAEPRVWTAPVGGNTTLATSLTTPLDRHARDFSIINGIYVDNVFAAHTQAENLWFTGNAFGGDTYLPFINLNTPTPKAPLDGLKNQSYMYFQTQNMGGHLPFGSQSTAQLSQKLKYNGINEKSDSHQYLKQRLQDIGKGSGKFSEGVRRMAQAQTDSVTLAEQLTKTNMTIDPKLDQDEQFLTLFNQLSQQKSIRTGLITISSVGPNNEYRFDTHDMQSAALQPESYRLVFERIARIFDIMKRTAFSATESLLDVTTVVVTTEFGRTMRQMGVAIDATGTDHNTFCTSAIIAGKGILGGKLIGASDYHSPTERLSNAHLSIDKYKLNIMARPFDFATQSIVEAKPETFNIAHYLNVGSIINTIFDITHVDKSLYRKIGNGTAAKILPSLTTLIK